MKKLVYIASPVIVWDSMCVVFTIVTFSVDSTKITKLKKIEVFHPERAGCLLVSDQSMSVCGRHTNGEHLATWKNWDMGWFTQGNPFKTREILGIRIIATDTILK